MSELVKVELELDKDVKELIDFMGEVAEYAMAKKPLEEWAALLPKVMPAIDGVQNVGPGMSGQYRDEAAGYLVHVLMDKLLPVKEVEVAPVQPEA